MINYQMCVSSDLIIILNYNFFFHSRQIMGKIQSESREMDAT